MGGGGGGGGGGGSLLLVAKREKRETEDTCLISWMLVVDCVYFSSKLSIQLPVFAQATELLKLKINKTGHNISLSIHCYCMRELG